MILQQIIPHAFSFGALFAGVGAILHAAAGNYALSAQLIALAMILDGLDGKIARKLGVVSQFGAELDTFIDAICFGLAPALLAWYVALKHLGVWGLLFVFAMVASGVARLARFRVVDPFRGQRGYLGLPITVNAGWIAMWVFMTEAGSWEGMLTLRGGWGAALAWASSAMFVLLQVSHVRYGKPTKAPVVMAGGMVMVALLFLHAGLALVSAALLCGFAFLYGLVTPFFPRHDFARVVQTGEDLEESEVDDEDPVEASSARGDRP